MVQSRTAVENKERLPGTSDRKKDGGSVELFYSCIVALSERVRGYEGKQHE
jgi:hypothetical protein